MGGAYLLSTMDAGIPPPVPGYGSGMEAPQGLQQQQGAGAGASAPMQAFPTEGVQQQQPQWQQQQQQWPQQLQQGYRLDSQAFVPPFVPPQGYRLGSQAPQQGWPMAPMGGWQQQQGIEAGSLLQAYPAGGPQHRYQQQPQQQHHYDYGHYPQPQQSLHHQYNIQQPLAGPVQLQQQAYPAGPGNQDLLLMAMMQASCRLSASAAVMQAEAGFRTAALEQYARSQQMAMPRPEMLTLVPVRDEPTLAEFHSRIGDNLYSKFHLYEYEYCMEEGGEVRKRMAAVCNAAYRARFGRELPVGTTLTLSATASHCLIRAPNKGNRRLPDKRDLERMSKKYPGN